MIIRLIKKVLCGERLTSRRLLNPIQTVLCNFRALPFSQARHLPLSIYCGMRIYELGKITITSRDIRRGMISIGKQSLKSQGNGKWLNRGEIVFGGPAILGGGTILENRGKIIFEGETLAGEGSMFLIRDSLFVGKYTRIGFQSFFMDSDDHFTINSNNKVVKRNQQPIVIGRYNWLANRTCIKKGTITPDYTIAASSNTLLAKDYTGMGEYLVLGGMPAKVIGSGIRRIYNKNAEAELLRYFREHPDIDEFIPNISDEELDAYCLKDPLP